MITTHGELNSQINSEFYNQEYCFVPDDDIDKILKKEIEYNKIPLISDGLVFDEIHLNLEEGEFVEIRSH